ncbi:glycosyltransferase [Azospirillum cavernae]|uniref:Glycosyltransferase n=1 Tax=Azospirillum cavernae TaxID=2320860 RepID=A0A418VP76_9PROT|nr:glycosyltransferase [Azospirillum cavernae]
MAEAAVKPNLREAVSLFEAGCLMEAERLCKLLLKDNSVNVGANHLLGVSLCSRGQYKEGADFLENVVDLQPLNFNALRSLGDSYQCQHRHEDAVRVYRRCLSDKGSLLSTYIKISICLNELGLHDEAIRACKAAIALSPSAFEAYFGLGSLLQDQYETDGALIANGRSAALAPDRPEPITNIGLLLKESGSIDAAIAVHRHAISIFPNYAYAHINLAAGLLASGQWDEGWNEYEWRWQAQDLGFRRPTSDKPEWTGQDLTGQTLLICEEQGFGDTLQFIRLAALVRPLCARVVVQCRAPLARIIASAAGVDEVVTEFPDRSGYDCWVSLMSLMARLGVTLDSVPATTPYLFTPADARRSWASVVPTSGTLKVGLVWAGDPKLGCAAARKMDSRRSMALSQFAPLAQIPDVTWVSLQKGPASKQVESAPGGLALIDPMDGVRDYADTAAIIEQLDLVIGVDTSVIHLAGALGKPVWALSRFDGCWRWLLDRDDSPWYPTLRLFRQERPGDWGPVVERVKRELTLVAEGAGDTVLCRSEAE